MIVANNQKVCTGCLICELACSFHHRREYSRVHSSIKVKKTLFDPEKGAEIAICSKNDGSAYVCDSCKGEDSPLCIRFCPENVFKLNRVEG